MSTNVEEASLAELAAAITSGAVRLAAATASWLRLVAEFDERGGWQGVGIHSCAHWLAWQCGLGPGAAREHVRVARTMCGLPRIEAAFAAGRLSYSKVRALTRIAEPDSEEALLAGHRRDDRVQPGTAGRRRRRATKAQPCALLRRDGGCARPGCPETRIERLHAHHLRHWLFGGRTDLANLVLPCDADHCLVHDSDLVMSRTDGRLVVLDPGGHRVWGTADAAFAGGLTRRLATEAGVRVVDVPAETSAAGQG